MNNLHNNFVVRTPELRDSDIELLFGPFDEGEDIIFIEPEDAASTTIVDLLVQAGFFSSKSQARKAGFEPVLPTGFFDRTIGKKRRRITIFNPTAV